MAINYQLATASGATKMEKAAVTPSDDGDEWEEAETSDDEDEWEEGEETDTADDEGSAGGDKAAGDDGDSMQIVPTRMALASDSKKEDSESKSSAGKDSLEVVPSRMTLASDSKKEGSESKSSEEESSESSGSSGSSESSESSEWEDSEEEGSEEQGSSEEGSAEEGSAEEGSKSKKHGCGDGGERKYDLIVYGATGAIGQKAASYLANHPDKPTFAIAGRNSKKLHKLFDTLNADAGAVYDALDLSNKTAAGAIEAMTGSAKVVLNLAGPFEVAGAERLVKAAIDTCTHYVDTSVETAWKASLLRKYGKRAEANEVAVVNSAGFVATPGDLLSMLAATRLAADHRGAPSKVVLAWTKWNGFDSPSYFKSAGTSLLKHGPLMDRYALAPHAMSKVNDYRAFEEWIRPEQKLFKMQLQASPSATTVVPIIQQSLAAEFKDDPVIAREVDATQMQAELAQWRMNPGNWMSHGSFAGEAIAFRKAVPGKTKADSAVRVAVEGNSDPAVTGSSKMAVEVALGLAASSSGAQRGFTTPSLALGGPENLQRRLERVDGGNFMQFSIGKKFLADS